MSLRRAAHPVRINRPGRTFEHYTTIGAGIAESRSDPSWIGAAGTWQGVLGIGARLAFGPASRSRNDRISRPSGTPFVFASAAQSASAVECTAWSRYAPKADLD